MTLYAHISYFYTHGLLFADCVPFMAIVLSYKKRTQMNKIKEMELQKEILKLEILKQESKIRLLEEENKNMDKVIFKSN